MHKSNLYHKWLSSIPIPEVYNGTIEQRKSGNVAHLPLKKQWGKNDVRDKFLSGYSNPSLNNATLESRPA
jgi:hypothetical protein